MGLHRMPSDIGIITNIGVVEVCHPLLLAGILHCRRVDWGAEGGHFVELGAANSSRAN